MRTLSASLITLLIGCQSMTEEVPAVLVEPSERTRESLQDAISGLLGGTPVRLAPDAFLQTSLLTLEHAPRRTLEGQRPDSLLVDRPEQFRLVRSGSRCQILRVKTGERADVQAISCRASP